MAGYRELLAIDFDENSRQVFELNFPDVKFWKADIRGISAESILEATGLKSGELDVLDGSPPCQGFSTAGKRDVDDSRNDLFLEFCRLLKGLRPRAFVMENVSGMAKGKMRGRFNEILRELRSCGYSVRCKLLNAANYGVPQARQRLFFVGIRLDISGAVSSLDWYPSPAGKPKTVANAIMGMEQSGGGIAPKNKARHLAKMIKPGENGGKIHPKRHYFGLMRLAWNRPANTIIRTMDPSYAGMLHPSEDRYLTIAELKRIASFPDSFQFTGKFEEQWARIGNAVMPLQMKAVAARLREVLSTAEGRAR